MCNGVARLRTNDSGRSIVGALDDLLSVQTTDIELTQASFRLAHLPERDAFAIAETTLRGKNSERDTLSADCNSIESTIASLEATSSSLDADVARLERQLKTVIAPREAEALQHEIAERRSQRAAGDERELELMEELETKRTALEAIHIDVALTTTRRDEAARALKSARGVVEAEIAALTERRSAQALVVPVSLLAIYEHKRKARPEGAVARLTGPTCGSCHMDLARTEIDALRALPAEEHPECPQCGCFIVL